MVRKGSPVRVRQRALTQSPQHRASDRRRDGQRHDAAVRKPCDDDGGPSCLRSRRRRYWAGDVGGLGVATQPSVEVATAEPRFAAYQPGARPEQHPVRSASDRHPIRAGRLARRDRPRSHPKLRRRSINVLRQLLGDLPYLRPPRDLPDGISRHSQLRLSTPHPSGAARGRRHFRGMRLQRPVRDLQLRTTTFPPPRCLDVSQAELRRELEGVGTRTRSRRSTKPSKRCRRCEPVRPMRWSRCGT